MRWRGQCSGRRLELSARQRNQDAPSPILRGEAMANDRTILLTGATGFVGRALRPVLESAGWHVRGLTRNVERARA
ncbi:MAG: NAD-dependent epimerase/dehydratase family protein, partial [Acidimicrobiia bacterium]